MKLKNIQVKNINKKLIAGTLIFTLSIVPITGCATIKDIKYTTDESGYINGIEGTITYKLLKKCYFCEIKNNITEETYYTICYMANTYRGSHGYDIFTKQDFSKGDFDLEIVDEVEDWLVSLNKVKENYVEEELREILNIFIEKQETKTKK